VDKAAALRHDAAVMMSAAATLRLTRP